MGNVGLLYVGAVLFINGLMLLGFVEPKSASPMNLMVGALQVITPTYLIFTAGGDRIAILGASGLYLFGFTYLYVAYNNLANLDGAALGWFSFFVAVCAVIFALINFGVIDVGADVTDIAFGVIWLHWAFLWALFFVLLALGRSEIGHFTGFVAVVQGWITGVVPAFLLLTGHWADNTTLWATLLIVFAVVLYGGGLAIAPKLAVAAPNNDD